MTLATKTGPEGDGDDENRLPFYPLSLSLSLLFSPRKWKEAHDDAAREDAPVCAFEWLPRALLCVENRASIHTRQAGRQLCASVVSQSRDLTARNVD